MRIKGYKAFDSNMNNRYGCSFVEGEKYRVSGAVKFGLQGNGYHFCERLEDTLRYVDGMTGNVQIAEVVGSGEIVESYDNYYGYYDMYAAEELEVLSVVPRDEIIRMYLGLRNPERVKRFIQGYLLTDEEIDCFKTAFNGQDDIIKTIAYYQEGDKDAFHEERGHVFKKTQ